MASRRKSCFILLFLQLCVVICKSDTDFFDSTTLWSEKEYVDPHSFYYDKITQKEILPQADSDDRRSGENTSDNIRACKVELNKCKAQKMSTNTDIPDESFSRRFVSMLLDRATFKKEDSKFIGHINLEATEALLNTLREFGAGKLTLREVDPILHSVVKAPDVNRVYETVLKVQWFTTESISFMSCHKEVIMGILIILYLYWTLRNEKWNFWKILSISIPIILIASFFITWWKLIEDARIKHFVLQAKHMEMPIQCQPDKMTWTDTITSWFYTDDCEKYYEAMIKNPDLEVTPGQALTHMVAHMLYEPIALSGKTIAVFLKEATRNMPWWLSYLIQGFICVLFIPTIIICTVLLLGGSLNLGFGPLSFFSLRGSARSERSQNQTHESKIDRRPIENVPNITFHLHVPDSGRVEITSGDQSHKLAITGNSSAEGSNRSHNPPARQNSDSGGRWKNWRPKRSKKEETSSAKVITNCDSASGDSISTKKSDSPKKSSAAKVIEAVIESAKPKSGSGDN